MNIHTILQIIGTCFVAVNVVDSWKILWTTPIQHKRSLRLACVRLCCWCSIAGLTLGYWLDVLFS